MKEERASTLVPAGAEISSYEIPNLKGKPLPTYQQIKDTFKVDALPKQNRFALSELVVGQLSVEQEEQRRFEKKVSEELEARLKIIKSEAHATAYAKGLEEGKTKAYDEEKSRIAQRLESLATAQQAIVEAKTLLADQYEKVIIDIVFRVAKVIVHKEIEMHPEAIHATLSAILQRIAKEDDVRIRLSPSEFEAINEIKQEIDKMGRVGRLTYEMDPTVKVGNCIVESLSGEIASYLDEKIEILRTEIDRARTQRREGTSGG